MTGESRKAKKHKSDPIARRQDHRQHGGKEKPPLNLPPENYLPAIDTDEDYAIDDSSMDANRRRLRSTQTLK